MEKKIEQEATLVERNLKIQIDALNLIVTTMPAIMRSRFFDSGSFLHQKFLRAMHDLQLSVMILQELTNNLCEDVIAKSKEAYED